MYGTDTIARILGQEDYEQRLVRYFSKVHREGCSHVVLDFLLWNRLAPGDSQRLAEFMRKYPPDKIVPNPVARHEQTFMEDGDIPDLRDDPLAWNLYVYRLARFAGTPGGESSAVELR